MDLIPPIARALALVPRRASRGNGEPASSPELRWTAAALALTTGATATRPDGSRAIRRLPLILAPVLGVTQVVASRTTDPRARTMARVLGTVALGVAAAELALASYRAVSRRDREGTWRGGHRPTRREVNEFLAPVAFGATGLLTLLLEREERRHAEALRERRRTSLAKRIVPRRKARVDRIVVHV